MSIAPRSSAQQRTESRSALLVRSLALGVLALAGVGCAAAPPSTGKFQPADEARQAELARDPTIQQLLAIAKARIDAEHDILITGDASRFDPSTLALTADAAAELDE